MNEIIALYSTDKGGKRIALLDYFENTDIIKASLVITFAKCKIIDIKHNKFFKTFEIKGIVLSPSDLPHVAKNHPFIRYFSYETIKAKNRPDHL